MEMSMLVKIVPIFAGFVTILLRLRANPWFPGSS